MERKKAILVFVLTLMIVASVSFLYLRSQKEENTVYQGILVLWDVNYGVCIPKS